MLETFGVSREAEEVYLALLADSGADAAALGKRLHVPTAQINAALAELTEFELLREGDGAVHGLWKVRAPEDAIEFLIGQEHRRLEEQKRSLEDKRKGVTEMVKTFVESRTAASTTEQVETIADPNAVRSRIYLLAGEARQSAAQMVPGEAFDEPTTAWSMRVDLEMLKRGLRLRLIVTEVSLQSEHWSDYLNVVTAEGA